MAKTCVAIAVGKNHDWDFDIDEFGQITKLNISSEVDYTHDIRRGEVLDIWPVLNASQKAQFQVIYDLVKTWFNNQIL